MSNPNFTASISTNELYRDLDTTVCLTDILDGYDASFDSLPSTYAAANHSHSGYADSDDIAALQSAISSKANVSHTHTEYDYDDDITALQSSVASKADSNHAHSEYSAIGHTHYGYATTSALDALQDEVDGKASASHSHSNYSLNSHNHDSVYSAINHTHTGYASTSDVTALQASIASKSDANHTHTGYASTSHNHDSDYYTQSSVDSKLSAKADSSALTSHTGNSDIHVTTTNKGNWDAAYAHSQSAHYSHPTSSGYKHVPSGGASGNVLQWVSDGTAQWGVEKYGDRVVTTTGTGAAYVAEVEGIASLTAGVSFIMIPHVTPTQVNPTLNVNGLGAKNLRMRVSNSTVTTTPLSTTNLIYMNRPTRVMYDGTQWVIDIVRPNVTNLYGTVALTQGGTGATTAAAARTNLDVYSKAEVEALIAQAIANL